MTSDRQRGKCTVVSSVGKSQEQIELECAQEFRGERMECCLCGRQEWSHPDVASDWYLLHTCGRKFYACPDHDPPAGSPPEAFHAAQMRLLAHCALALAGEQSPGATR